MKSRKCLRGLLYLLSLPIVLACDGRSAFSDYSNYDLKREYQDCKSSNLSPGGAQRCANIEKECERRRQETGIRC